MNDLTKLLTEKSKELETLKKLQELDTKLKSIDEEYETKRNDAIASAFGTKMEYQAALKTLEMGSPTPRAKSTKPVVAGEKKTRAGRGDFEAKKDAFKKDAEGGMTGEQLAEKYGISAPSVHNWKTRLGLVKSRKKK